MNSGQLKKLDLINFIVSVSAGTIGFLAFSTKVGVGLTAGTLLMTLNFFVLRRLSAFILTGLPKQMRLATLLLLLKLGLFFTAVWLCMTYLPMSPFAFGIGAALIVLVLVVSASASRAESTDA
jgi:hypothetical protein